MVIFVCLELYLVVLLPVWNYQVGNFENFDVR